MLPRLRDPWAEARGVGRAVWALCLEAVMASGLWRLAAPHPRVFLAALLVAACHWVDRAGGVRILGLNWLLSDVSP